VLPVNSSWLFCFLPPPLQRLVCSTKTWTFRTYTLIYTTPIPLNIPSYLSAGNRRSLLLLSLPSRMDRTFFFFHLGLPLFYPFLFLVLKTDYVRPPDSCTLYIFPCCVLVCIYFHFVLVLPPVLVTITSVMPMYYVLSMEGRKTIMFMITS